MLKKSASSELFVGFDQICHHIFISNVAKILIVSTEQPEICKIK